MTMESDILLCHSDSSRRLHVVHIVNYSILSPPLGKKKRKGKKREGWTPPNSQEYYCTVQYYNPKSQSEHLQNVWVDEQPAASLSFVFSACGFVVHRIMWEC